MIQLKRISKIQEIKQDLTQRDLTKLSQGYYQSSIVEMPLKQAVEWDATVSMTLGSLVHLFQAEVSLVNTA